MKSPIEERASRHNIKQLHRLRRMASRIGGMRGAYHLVNAITRFRKKASAQDLKELTWFLVR